MPTSNGSVTFAYGKQEDYDKLEKNPSAIYFCEDTQRLFVGSTEFAPRQLERSVPSELSDHMV